MVKYIFLASFIASAPGYTLPVEMPSPPIPIYQVAPSLKLPSITAMIRTDAAYTHSTAQGETNAKTIIIPMPGQHFANYLAHIKTVPCRLPIINKIVCNEE